MKGVLLSFGAFVFLVLVTVLIFRIYKGKRYLNVFLTGYGIGILFYSVFYGFTPASLGFLPDNMILESAFLGYWNGFLILFMLAHCFADVSYTTVLTGFSTQLVVLLSEKGSLTATDIKEIYGTTGKEDPVTELRLNHLTKSRYVVEEKGGYRILPKGRMVGRITKFLQRLFNTDMGG